MNNRRKNKTHKPSRLDRIERKCDIILSELTIIRKSLKARPHSVDGAIDRMHRTARRMRTEAERDTRLLRKVFQSKVTD